MSAITIENSNITIQDEMVERDGLVIVTLAVNAYLIIHANDWISYPPEKLDKLQANARALTRPTEPTHNYHPTKVRALRELRAKGIAVSGGEEYGLKPSPVSLEKVRQGLASIKGSLADRIIAERDER
ncbi:MAG TPA: hypothetical protein VF429_03720 [Anaerolineae bacterium]|jgi:hypothetical protein